MFWTESRFQDAGGNDGLCVGMLVVVICYFDVKKGLSQETTEAGGINRPSLGARASGQTLIHEVSSRKPTPHVPALLYFKLGIAVRPYPGVCGVDGEHGLDYFCGRHYDDEELAAPTVRETSGWSRYHVRV